MLCTNTCVFTRFNDNELYILKKIWENLSEKNDFNGISKETFCQYIQLNVLLVELLYDKFNRTKLDCIDYDDFIYSLDIICFGSTLDHINFLFDMCNINENGMIPKSVISLLLHAIPFNTICSSTQTFDEYINNIFTLHSTNVSLINFDNFKKWIIKIPKIMEYIKEHIPYNVDNNLDRHSICQKLDILPKVLCDEDDFKIWMFKKCKRLGLLKKQYYYLHGSCLYYYSSQDDIKPHGVIYLVGSLIKPINDIHKNLHALEIIQLDICSGEHKIHDTRILYCESLETRNITVNHLQNASHMTLFGDKYNYDINDEIGSGAFSTVYLCSDKLNNNKYAVKIICKQNFHQLDKEHYRNEINILKMIHHENIIKTYDIFETTDTICIVTEYVKDGDLVNYIQNRSCFNDEELKPLAKQLFECILYLHELGIVHSDIKPDNMLYNQTTEQIKLIDFGLSKILLPNKKINNVGGTLSYVSPEAIISNSYGKESDIWAIGVIIYLLVYGKLPFDEYVNEEYYESHTLQNILKNHAILNGKKSLMVNSLISQLLLKNPLNRFTAKQALNHGFFK